MSNCSPETGHSIGLQDALNNKIGKLPRPTAIGRVEPKSMQGCLPKSCHPLNLGMENFVSILSGRNWPIVLKKSVFHEFWLI
jgi:hypothetical protein